MKKFRFIAAISMCFFGITVFTQIPANGLVAYYPFNGNANDESGNGNNGTVYGASLIADRYGALNRAYKFNGNSDYLSINTISNVTGNSPRTVSAWIKLDELAVGYNTIYKGGTNGGGFDFTFIVVVSSSNLIQLYLRRYINDVWSESITISSGKWINVSVTYDGTNTNGIKFYCNGQSKQAYNGSTDIFDTQPTNPFIGDYISQGGYHSYFKGAIDDICIYNRELSAVEIAQLYQEYEVCDNKDNDGDGWIDETCVPSLSIADKQITEGNSGTKNFSFKVTLTHEYNLPVTCAYKTINNTATAGSDFKLKTGTLVFNPGEKSKNITVKVNGDLLYEPDETFTVQIGQQVNATISRANANGIILNDDADCNPYYIDGFDYPFGDRGIGADGSRYTIAEGITPECNNLYPEHPELEPKREPASSNLDGWWNSNDVGNYLGKPNGYPKQCGLHPGEDWNFKDKDEGEGVFATANGKIIEIATVRNDGASEGYRLTIEHVMPTGEKIWSLYLHVTDLKNLNGAITKPVFTDSVVKKGDLIARIAEWDHSHLHFEIRIFNPGIAVWEHGNGMGYYTDLVNEKRCNRMTVDQVSGAFSNMSLDGIIDPSDFIEHNRVICNAGIQALLQYPPYNCVTTGKQFTSAANISDKSNVGLKIYISPNPVKSLLYINGLIATDRYNIKIINASGMIVINTNYLNGQPIHVASLPAGFYVVLINNTTKLKFIKEE